MINRMMIAASAYRELARFLVGKRESTTREQVGLNRRPGRLTRHLLAKDICFLSGVSISTYEQLERGRFRYPTRRLFTRIAKALRLTEADTNTLLLLADLSVWCGPNPNPLAQTLLDNIKTCPAYTCTPRLDVVAYNRLADALFDFNGDGSPNALNQIFRIYGDPKRRRRHKSPAAEKNLMLAALKKYLAQNPSDPGVTDLAAELSRVTPTFIRDWATLVADDDINASLELLDGKVGAMTLKRLQLSVAGGDESTYMLVLVDEASEKAIRAIRAQPWMSVARVGRTNQSDATARSEKRADMAGHAFALRRV